MKKLESDRFSIPLYVKKDKDAPPSIHVREIIGYVSLKYTVYVEEFKK